MKVEQLTYTPMESNANDHLPTMVLMVDPAMLQKYKKDKSVPLADVVDSFDVLKYASGRSGQLNRPSRTELENVFGTNDNKRIVEFMLERGSMHSKHMHAAQYSSKGSNRAAIGTRI